MPTSRCLAGHSRPREASGSNPSLASDRSSTSRSRSEDRAAPRRQILLVEDNAADVFLIREAIRCAGIDGEVHVIRDGHKAAEFLDSADNDSSVPRPDLMLLDLNLPMKSGDEVLGHLRASRRCCDVPVLIVTSSDSENDREYAQALGAIGYFRNPSSYDEFMKLGALVRELLSGKPADPAPDA